MVLGFHDCVAAGQGNKLDWFSSESEVSPLLHDPDAAISCRLSSPPTLSSEADQ